VTAPRRLLSIEDNPVDAYLIRATFKALARRRAAARFELTQAASLAEGLRELERCDPHVVLLDLVLPDASGPQAVTRLAHARPDVPILVLTSRDDEALALRALQAGAQDYLVKGRLDMRLLDRVVLHAIERQRLSSALARAHERELERRDEFLSHVSHELRTPLSAIQQFASILGDGLTGELPAEQAECVEVVSRNARHLRRMVDDLLDVARLDAGRLVVRRAPVPLQPIVERTLADLSARVAQKGLRLSTRLSPTAQVYADPMRAGQVLANLLENAVKFTPEGGSIQVSLSAGQDGPEFVRLSVTDSGCGIEPGELAGIFGRLRQAPSAPCEDSRRGLGLGLHICRQIVERHGGWIWAESTPGEGSSFHVTLPVFSLERMLAPLLARREGRDEPFHVVGISWLEGQRPSARQLESVDAAVRRCGEEAQGVVLPSRSNGHERRLVLRSSGAVARALVQRLRRRLTRHASPSDSAPRPQISRHLLLSPPPGGCASVLPELGRRLGLSCAVATRLARTHSPGQAALHAPGQPAPQPSPAPQPPPALQRRQAKGTSSTMTQ